MITRKDVEVFMVFLSACLASGLRDTSEIDECFSWAIGEDWISVPMSSWKERAKRRGIHLPADVTLEDFVFGVVDLWRRRGN